MRSMMGSSFSMFEAAAGELGVARASAREAIAVARAARNPSALAMSLYALGWATATDEPETARPAFEESIALFHAGACDAVYVAALARLAPIMVLAGDVRGAIAALGESVRYTYDDGDRAPLVYAIDIAARVLAQLGRDEDASVLAGMSEAGVIARIGALLGPERVSRTEAFDTAKTRLGEDAFDRAFSRGGAMSYEEAVAHTLEALERARAQLDGAGDA